MLHENSVFDQQVYDGARNLTSGRVRCYKDKASALAQDPAGLLFTYLLTAAYTNSNLTFYRITREL
jgi:alkylated DNA nucleotide flippase Atl1